MILEVGLRTGILSLYALVQYKAQSLIEHLRIAWRTGGLLPDHFITVVPPQMRLGEMWYRGNADAVLQNLIEDFHPDLVAVFGADHIYRMDVSQMVAFHRECEADVTVAARPVSLAEAKDFGVLEVDRTGRIIDFAEKPDTPRSMPRDPLASSPTTSSRTRSPASSPTRNPATGGTWDPGGLLARPHGPPGGRASL